MKCPKCNSKSKVVITLPKTNKIIRTERTRSCNQCKFKFITCEIHQNDLSKLWRASNPKPSKDKGSFKKFLENLSEAPKKIKDKISG